MSNLSSQHSPESRPLAKGKFSASHDDANVAVVRLVSGGRIAGTLLLAGVCGSFIGILLIQQFGNWFPVQIPDDVKAAKEIPADVKEQSDRGEISGADVMGIMMGRITMDTRKEMQSRLLAAERDADFKNSRLAIALLGLSLAGLTGLLVGLLCRSWPMSLVGLVAGIVFGGGLGWLGGMAGFLLDEKLFNLLEDDFRSMLVHGAVFGTIAVAVSFTVVTALKQPAAIFRFLAAAIPAAVLAAVLYPVSAAVLFTADRVDLTLPSGFGNRMCWSLMGALLIAGAIGYSYNRTRDRVQTQ